MEGRRRTLGSQNAQPLPGAWGGQSTEGTSQEHRDGGLWAPTILGLNSQPLCLQAVWPWASHCSSLSPSLISKMETVLLIISHQYRYYYH